MTTPPKTVLVLRALMVGDLLCATPALRALRHGMPGAHISLLALPWARELCTRLRSVDEFIEFPGWPGLPEREPAEARALLRFHDEMRARQFDLAVQMHGSGQIVNALVASFGARQMVGFTPPGTLPDSSDAANLAEWPQAGSEVERLLVLTDHLGLPRQGEALDFPLHPADHEAAEWLLQGMGSGPGGWHGQPLALVHAGAQLPSRRWPAARFAEVADALADAGLAVVLTGSAAETDLTHSVAAAMRAPSLDLSGLTTLWVLGALTARAAVVVCNDTGISHIAAALGTPSVVVASGGDVARWAPADRSRHRVLWHDLPCRPCAYVQCPIGHPCALAVTVDAVRDAALAAAGRAPVVTAPAVPAPNDPPAAGTTGRTAPPPAHPGSPEPAR